MSDAAEGVLFFDDWSLDIARRELRRGEQPVDLRPKSFDVLACLARNAGRVVTKDELMTAVWAGASRAASSNSTARLSMFTSWFHSTAGGNQ